MTAQEPSLGWREVAWSVAVGIAAAFLLMPLFASIAQGQPVDVPPEEVALDLVGIAVSATVLALATEWLRSLVPQWRRGGDMGELAKTALRIVPVALGVAAALAGWAPPVGDGSNPELFGGVGAGLIASLFGGSLVTAVRDRLPGARDRKRLAAMTTGQFRVERANDEAQP